MAVSLVGTGTFIKSTNNGNATTLTFSTAAGITSSGDIVIASWIHTRGTIVGNLRSSAGTAYTTLDSTNNGNLGTLCAYRILTSAETTVTSCATGSGQDSVVLSAIVLRNVDQTPLINSSGATGTSSQPNGPAILVQGPNDALITLAAILANAPPTAPAGFGSAVSTGATDTRSCAGGMAYVSTDGPVTADPGPWTSSASAAWLAFAISVRSTEPIPVSWFKMTSYPDMINEQMPMIGY